MSTNSLIHEQSPYLLQHAHNPVDWLPWGDEAFAKAKAEDKPIFLSVGYSTCHWCHVMERESFESEEIAALLNRYFVSVKVDREERPDVDRIYMTFVQAVTQSGGWPMSVWLTPEGKPFYGGTYFPPDNRYGRPGFSTLLQHLAQAWQSDRPRILESSEAVLRELSQQTAVQGGAAPTDIAPAERCYTMMQRSFDRQYGGFGSAPKFPRPVALHFLFRYALAAQEPQAQEMALATLRAMAAGGMHDQLGGGFHRYSVDERWFVPHFEKMLYDQAQLASSYLEAYQLTRDTQYADTARKIFAYVLRDMTHPTGAFYCAEDADSIIHPDNPKEKGEGAFYIWLYEELMAVLGKQNGELFAEYYGVEQRGNVANDPHQEFTGRNILAISAPLEEVAVLAGISAPQAETVLAEAQQMLLSVRAVRPRPHLDDKILTSWNAMMISAFAAGARVLQSEEYTQAATRAFSFLRQRLWQPEQGVLLRRYREGDAAIAGFLDDYALLAQAALDVFTLNNDPSTLTFALQVIDSMRTRFEDQEQGGFYSSEPAEDLVLRLKDDYDGAEPSGNSVAAAVLVRAGRLCERQDLLDSAERVFAAFSSRLQQSPLTIPYLVSAWMESQAAPQHIVLAGSTSDPQLEEMQQTVASRFLPQASVLLVASEEQHGALQASIPLLQQLPYTTQATAYVCQEYACRLPVHTAADLAQLLDEPSSAATLE